MNQATMDRWWNTNGEELQHTYNNLDENSIVFDIGGYHGTWSDKIIEKYNPYVYIFEPLKEFYDIILNHHKDNFKVKVFHMGLGNKTETTSISVAEGASSTKRVFPDRPTEEVKIKNISEFINEEKFEHIHLMKINIEGDEYALLSNLIETSKVAIIGNIQVQYHDFVPNAMQMRYNLTNQLSLTHRRTWNLDFIWENWEVIYNNLNKKFNHQNIEENLLKFIK